MEPKTVRRAAGGKSAAPDIEPANALIAGTTVMTLEGEMPVEFLNPGDKVITRDSGIAVLRELRVQQTKADCVSIKAGSLGNTRPDRDALVLAGQQVLIRDWRSETLFGTKQALVPAERLIDGEYVAAAGARDVTLCELVFDAPHIIYADGLELAADAKVLETA